jgi:hypothetical protein
MTPAAPSAGGAAAYAWRVTRDQESSSRVRRAARKVAIVLSAIVAIKLAWFWVYRPGADDLAAGGARVQTDIRARHAYLVDRLLSSSDGGRDALAPGDAVFAGEWALVTLSMTAAATASLVWDDPGGRPGAAATLAALIDGALSPQARAFDTRMWGEDPLDSLGGDRGHAGYLGHLGLMMGLYRLLGGDGRFDATSTALHRALADRMSRSPSGCIATYPGEIYTADNTVLLASLAVHGMATGHDTSATIRRWVAHARAHLLDPDTGLIVRGAGERGEPLGRGRGSWAGWNVFYLMQADPELAADQYDRLRAHLVVEAPALGLAAVREYPADSVEQGDVDSGPLLFGVSPAATGFAIAGARHAGDWRLLAALLGTAELAGTTASWGYRRRYLLAPLVGDAIVLAMRTARRWQAPAGRR